MAMRDSSCSAPDSARPSHLRGTVGVAEPGSRKLNCDGLESRIYCRLKLNHFWLCMEYAMQIRHHDSFADVLLCVHFCSRLESSLPSCCRFCQLNAAG